MKRNIFVSRMHHNNDDAVYVLESFLNITIPQGIKLSILPIFVPNTARGTTNVSFLPFPFSIGHILLLDLRLFVLPSLGPFFVDGHLCIFTSIYVFKVLRS